MGKDQPATPFEVYLFYIYFIKWRIAMRSIQE